MPSRSTRAWAVVLVVGLGLATAACGQYSISNIRALKAFKDANDAYRKGDFKTAAEGYQHALDYNPDFYGITYFFLGNSYDNMYKPSRKGEPDNDANLQKAVENYKLAIQKIKDTDPDAEKYRKLSYEYLIAAYGSDKLNDFSQAEPVAKQLIAIEPDDPSNYQALGKLYEDQGRYDEAEAAFKKAIEIKPNDPLGYELLAGYYNRQGQFDKTIEAFQQRANLEPNNPEAWQMIAAYCTDKNMRDKTMSKAKALEYIQTGIAADDKALALNPDYFDALSYKNILLRMQANYEKNPAKQKELLDAADKLRNHALEVQKKQGGTGSGGGGGEP
jgi:tetratricopeptide (TPR) repeat protein